MCWLFKLTTSHIVFQVSRLGTHLNWGQGWARKGLVGCRFGEQCSLHTAPWVVMGFSHFSRKVRCTLIRLSDLGNHQIQDSISKTEKVLDTYTSLWLYTQSKESQVLWRRQLPRKWYLTSGLAITHSHPHCVQGNHFCFTFHHHWSPSVLPCGRHDTHNAGGPTSSCSSSK